MLKKLFFLHYIVLASLSKISWLYLCGSISRCYVIFYWSIRSIFIFYHQHHTVFNTEALVLKSNNVILVLLFQYYVDYSGLLPLHINFIINLLISTKSLLKSLIWIALNVEVEKNWYYDNVKDFNPWKYKSFYFVLLWFHLSEFCSFSHLSICIYFVRFIPKYFIFRC